MRLLNCNFEFSHYDDNPPPYAILSHTWSENNKEEVTYQDLENGIAKVDAAQKSLLKLQLCRDWTKAAGYEYFWIDTCCIDKVNDAELAYAIRSMWRWYHDASVCFVYLADLSKKRERDGRDWRDTLKDCRWFTRGWTLQELVASKNVEFYARDGGYLGSGDTLSQELKMITGIDLSAPLPSQSQRLKWVDNRRTKRPEDKAYCMLGICEVSLDPRYGEGGKSAWRRLLDEIRHRHGTIALEDTVGDHRQTVMQALRFNTMETRRKTVKVALAKTCRWILSHPACARWLKMKQKFFWIKGKPGAGKSVLIKYLDQHITRQLEKQNAIGLYFYFNARGEQLEKSFLGLYRSLLVQLVDAVPEMSKELDRLGTPFVVADLQDRLASAIRDCGKRVWLFIDALDECREDDVHEMITFLGQLHDVELYACFASRHYPVMDNFAELQLILEEVNQHSDDLAKYVEKLKLKLMDKELIEIQQEIVKKANGIFLWVVLVVDILEKELRNCRFHVVQDRLREIPSDLTELFKTIIHRDDESIEEFILCLRWILYAQRPLVLSEWFYAMSAGIEQPLEAQANMTDIRMETFLLSSSKGLAELTKVKTITVQFIHESVRDFLVKDDGLREVCREAGSLEAIAHEQLKHCCLRGMAFEIPQYNGSDGNGKELLTKDQRQSLMTRYPFAKYATTYIVHHTDRAAIGCSQQQFLAANFSISDWMTRFNAFQERGTNVYGYVPSWTYLCAERDLVRLMPRPCTALTVEKQRYGSPLVASFVSSSWKVARILLKEMEVQDIDAVLQEAMSCRLFTYSSERVDSIPRRWAIRNGLLHLSKHLLASVDASGLHGFGTRPKELSLAVASGNAALFEHIITAFPSTATSKEVEMSLYNASIKGYIDIVRLLLGNATREQVTKALEVAATPDRIEIVRLLLDKGADVNAQGGKYGNALQAAANGFRNLEIVRLLLDNGAKVNAQGGYYGTALHAASAFGQVETVRLLLDNGANVNAQGGYYATALQTAAARCENSTVRLLLDNGANVNAQGGKYGNALQAAAARCNVSTVRLLLDRGANVNAQGGEYGTALQAAAA